MNPLTWAYHHQLLALIVVHLVVGLIAALPTIRTWPGDDPCP